jgi:N utilization substance protein A
MGTLYQSIEILSKEKGIDPEIVVGALKDAMLAAARKQFKTQEALAAEFDPATGAVLIFGVRKIVETVEDPLAEITLEEAQKIDPAAQLEGEVRTLKDTQGLGRISAQTAKQVILQKIREAERENIYREFSDRVGEMISCTVKRFEGPDIVVDVGRNEGRIPRREQSRLESFSVGDRIRAIVKSVERTGRNPGVVISRADAEFVARLFEQEVPEIYDGTVLIRGCAREAGERTKIAVQSQDRDVDSVGACVGMKGMRVQSIIRELRGEKIDIIEYSEDPVTFAINALSPARITRVQIVDLEGKHMEVIVDESQLSLAIGKKGQNVRLGAKLLGWRIDIRSEDEKRQEMESTMGSFMVSGEPVSMLLQYGMDEATVDTLVRADVGTIEKLASMTPEDLEALPDIDAEIVAGIQAVVHAYFATLEQAVQQEAAVAPAAAEEAIPIPQTMPEPGASVFRQQDFTLRPPLAPPLAQPQAEVEASEEQVQEEVAPAEDTAESVSESSAETAPTEEATAVPVPEEPLVNEADSRDFILAMEAGGVSSRSKDVYDEPTDPTASAEAETSDEKPEELDETPAESAETSSDKDVSAEPAGSPEGRVEEAEVQEESDNINK